MTAQILKLDPIEMQVGEKQAREKRAGVRAPICGLKFDPRFFEISLSFSQPAVRLQGDQLMITTLSETNLSGKNRRP